MRDKKLEDIRKFGKYGYVFSTYVLIFGVVLFAILLFFSLRFNKNIRSLEEVKIKNDIIVNMKFRGLISEEDYKNNPIKIILDNNYESSEEISTNQKDGETYITLKGNKYKDVNLSEFWKVLITVFIAIILYVINILIFRSIFKTLRDDESPFNKSIVEKLKVFALSLTPWIFISSIIEGIVSSGVFENHFEISISLNMLVFVAVIYLLARIFEYGVDLQVESDDIV